MPRKASWALMTFLAALVAAYAWASLASGGFRTPFVQALVDDKLLRAFGHLGAGAVAIVAGALQFNTRIRFERPRLHRRIGWTYLVAVLVSGTAGMLLAAVSTGGVPAHWGFFLLGLFWVTTALAAVARARAGEYDAHRRWMIRSYALCLAAVTLRLYLPLFDAFGVGFEYSYPAIAWLCWVPNLVVAEWFVVPSSLAPLDPPDPALAG